MPNVKQLQFQATIHAPCDAVSEVTLGPETYPKWTAPFAAGSYYEGSWSQGSRIKFLAPSGSGMVAVIAEHRPNEFVSIRHLGFVSNGVEDTESESVRSWAPAYENYTFITIPEGTQVVVDQDVISAYEGFMQESWPKALDALKQLCEDRPT